MQEEWSDIIGYEGLYRVSSLGRIESLPRERGHRKTTVLVKPVKMSNGYYKMTLSMGVRNRKLTSIHVLVAKAFIPNPQSLPQVNHVDGDKSNNTVTNLEWVTQSQNMAHKVSKESRSLALSKKVRQLDLRTLQEVRVWDSVVRAAEATGFNNSSICKAAKSGKPHRGFLWRYTDRLPGMSRALVQEPEGVLWDSLKKAHSAGFDTYLIRACANGTRTEHKGSTWRWASDEDMRCNGANGSVRLLPHGARMNSHPSMKGVTKLKK